jgi:NADH-quinone oxidoreductase subunit L
VGAYVAAVFHLVTHAFFKALLFLGSGSVIHGMEHGEMHSGDKLDTQDMFNMGGLRKKMPVTFWTFLIGGMALAGLPLITAGFWSKDEILSGALNGGYIQVFIVLALTALLTAFYTMRQITLIFLGEPRTKSAEHAHESTWTMTFPLVVLAIFAVAVGWAGIPKEFPLFSGSGWFQQFVGSMLASAALPAESANLTPLITSFIVSLGGLYLGWLVYRKVAAGEVDPLQRPLGKVYELLKNKYYIDEFYQAVFVKPSAWISETLTDRWIDRGLLDGILNGIASLGLRLGRLLRNAFDLPVINGAGDELAEGTHGFGSFLRVFQTGRVQQYMLAALVIVLLVAAIFYYFLVLV